MTKKLSKSPSKVAKAKPEPKPKSAQIVSLLRRQTGASLGELMKATGWQAHSVRGFISGTLGRKEGLKVASAKREDGDPCGHLRMGLRRARSGMRLSRTQCNR